MSPVHRQRRAVVVASIIKDLVNEFHRRWENPANVCATQISLSKTYNKSSHVSLLFSYKYATDHRLTVKKVLRKLFHLRTCDRFGRTMRGWKISIVSARWAPERSVASSLSSTKSLKNFMR